MKLADGETVSAAMERDGLVEAGRAVEWRRGLGWPVEVALGEAEHRSPLR